MPAVGRALFGSQIARQMSCNQLLHEDRSICTLRNRFLRFDTDPITIVALLNLHAHTSRFTARQDSRKHNGDQDDTFLHIITSELEISAMRATAQGMADEGHHRLARFVSDEADFRADVNFAIRGYQKIIARLDTERMFDHSNPEV